MKKWFQRLLMDIARPIIHEEMEGWKEYLDLQHGIRYSFYADGLQEKVNQLKQHVDNSLNICAERSILDRQMILKQNEQIASLRVLISEEK